MPLPSLPAAGVIIVTRFTRRLWAGGHGRRELEPEGVLRPGHGGRRGVVPFVRVAGRFPVPMRCTLNECFAACMRHARVCVHGHVLPSEVRFFEIEFLAACF